MKSKRLEFSKWEKRNRILKILSHNSILDCREKYLMELDESPLNSRISRIRNSCILTGRNRGLIRKYKCNRMMFKNKIFRGYIYGMKKRS